MPDRFKRKVRTGGRKAKGVRAGEIGRIGQTEPGAGGRRAGRWLKKLARSLGWAGMEISLPSETSEISMEVGKRVKKTQIEQSADLWTFQVSARLRTLSLLFIPSLSLSFTARCCCLEEPPTERYKPGQVYVPLIIPPPGCDVSGTGGGRGGGAAALGRAGRESTDPLIGLQGRSSHPPDSSLPTPGSSPMDDQLAQFLGFGRRGHFRMPLHLMSLLSRRQQQTQDPRHNRGGMSVGSRGAVQTGPRTTEPRSLAASQCSLAHRNVWVD